jgi:hypothetical protein
MAKAQKGSQYERDVCRQLSLWWTQDDRKPNDSVFWRTSQSGGRATTRAKLGKKTINSYGDIGFIDPVGEPFISASLLELKRGYTSQIGVLDFLDSNKAIPILQKWWDKGEKECELAGRKYTLIIFRRDRHRSCIFFDVSLFGKIQDWFGPFKYNTIAVKTPADSFVVLELDRFLAWCNPNFFIKS